MTRNLNTFLSLAMLLCALCGCAVSSRVESEITRGHLDLSEWSRSSGQDSIFLEGEWLFYPNQLIGPDQHGAKSELRTVPGTWQGERIDYGTYKLTIVAPGTRGLGILVPGYTSSCLILVNGQVVYSGGKVAALFKDSKPSKQRPPIIPLEASDTYEILIQVSNYIHARGGIYSPPKFGTYELLSQDRSKHISIDSMVAAAFLAIGLYHFIIYAIRRQLLVLVFASACTVIAVRSSFSNAQINQTFMQFPYEVAIRLEYISLYMINPLLESYLALMFRTEYPWKIFKFRLICFVLVVSTTILPIMTMSAALRYCHISHIIGILICVYTVMKARLRGQMGSTLILIGSTVFVFFSLLDIMLSLGAGPSSTYLLHIGFMAFIMSQSGAIALHYNDTFNRLVATEKEKDHSFEQLAKVFFTHQIAAIRQRKNLEDTMPTHSGQACVLSFDIVGSSKIKHIKTKDFFRNVFARCNELMMEGYDGIHLKARAYRIKEMGDGFLCSIGYPFSSISDNPAHDAIDLAESFVKVLAEESRMLHADEPITCGIGLAIDTLTGFYPEFGTKEYDIFGRAIVLATRYESMRKTLFPTETGRSVIIIQEVVYNSLDPQHRQGFQRVDLKEINLVVRDDPSATRLYYRFFEAFESSDAKNSSKFLQAI